MHRRNDSNRSGRTALFVVSALTSILFLTADVHAKILAKFGHIEGQFAGQGGIDGFDGWTELNEFELTGGVLGGRGLEVDVFEARYSFAVDSTYVPLLEAALRSPIMDVDMVFLADFESELRPYLTYQIEEATLGPVTLIAGAAPPMVSGRIVAAATLTATYQLFDNSGEPAGETRYQHEFAGEPRAVASPSVLRGDYSLDGQIDAEDFGIWSLLFGSNSVAADGNANGLVDGADFLVWQRGALAAPAIGGTSLAPAHPVPETGSLLGLGVCLFSTLLARGRRSSMAMFKRACFV